MLPTGHIAAGFLTGILVGKVFVPEVSSDHLKILGLWGGFFGFLPDIDEFWFFLKNKSLLVAQKSEKSHREFFTHAPVLWLSAGLLLIAVSEIFERNDLKIFGLLVWFSSWSHFLLDSVEYGIMWLWPKRKLYALFKREKAIYIPEKHFFAHSIHFLKEYSRTFSFYLEILIIAIALITFIQY